MNFISFKLVFGLFQFGEMESWFASSSTFRNSAISIEHGVFEKVSMHFCLRVLTPRLLEKVLYFFKPSLHFLSFLATFLHLLSSAHSALSNKYIFVKEMSVRLFKFKSTYILTAVKTSLSLQMEVKGTGLCMPSSNNEFPLSLFFKNELWGVLVHKLIATLRLSAFGVLF